MNSDDSAVTSALKQNSPAVTEDRSSSQLVVRGGTVFLPERCRCRPGDAEFDAQLEAILPDDVGPVLLRQMADKKRHPTFFLIPALLLFFALTLYFMYSFFPRMLPAAPGQLPIPAPAYAVPQPKHLYDIFKKAEKAFRRREYHECHQLLLPLLDQIGQKIPLTEATTLLYYYFESLHKGHFTTAVTARARGLLSQLCGQEPDQILWKIYYVAFNTRDLDYQTTFRNLSTGKLRDTWQFQHLRLQKARKLLDEAAAINRTLPESDVERRKNHEPLLDLLQCKVLVNLWLIEGGKGKSSLPDDLGDPGVEHRELAWNLASRPEYRNLLEFLQIRHFIVLTLKNQHHFANSFFFKGREYYMSDVLQQELDFLNLQMQQTVRQ